MKQTYKILSEEELGIRLDGGRLDETACLEILEKISKKEGGLSNIATFADLKGVRHLTHVKSDYSSEYLGVDTSLHEYPGKSLHNDGSSPNPYDFDFDYLYPGEPEVQPPVSTLKSTDLKLRDDVTMTDLPSHEGYLYGTVNTFDCDPEMKCPSCRGSRKCVRCSGRGEVRCDTCHGTGDCWKCGGRGVIETSSGYKECYICDGRGKCTSCKGSGWFRCPDCRGTTVCPRCEGDGVVKCSRCNGTGYYQTIMGFRTKRFAMRLHYPPMDSEMGDLIRKSPGENPHASVLRQWKNAKAVLPDRNYSMGDIGYTDEDVEREFRLIVRQYQEEKSGLETTPEGFVPYRQTWAASTVPESVIKYNVCGKDYAVHRIGTNNTLAFTEFPERLTIFDDNGQATVYSGNGEGRKIALAKLAAYIFKADNLDPSESWMITRICHCLGYSNKERWRLLAQLERFGPAMPFSELKDEIAPILKSKKTLCFAWHCIAVDNEVTDKERSVFDLLVREYDLSEDELNSLKAFTESKFAKLPEDQIVKEYIESEPRKVSVRKTVTMIVSAIALVISVLCQFVFETSDMVTLLLLPLSFTVFLLSLPFEKQREYTDTRPLYEPRPFRLYLLLVAGIIGFIWYVINVF